MWRQGLQETTGLEGPGREGEEPGSVVLRSPNALSGRLDPLNKIAKSRTFDDIKEEEENCTSSNNDESTSQNKHSGGLSSHPNYRRAIEELRIEAKPVARGTV